MVGTRGSGTGGGGGNNRREEQYINETKLLILLGQAKRDCRLPQCKEEVFIKAALPTSHLYHNN